VDGLRRKKQSLAVPRQQRPKRHQSMLESVELVIIDAVYGLSARAETGQTNYGPACWPLTRSARVVKYATTVILKDST